ncbi:MAG TPA: hypothetical protein PKC39_05315 [Ferruginibacter sp.]|nr:hypothetical protein [Ferruginibacter sp.]HMP20361.1 hypothetical protein [Ferruginibacter sp.]
MFFKKKVIVVLLLLQCNVNVYAQAKNTFLELGGPGLLSFNYDQRFTKSQRGFGGRIGAGGYHLDGATAVYLPVAVNYLAGKKEGKHYLELGAGVTKVFGTPLDDDMDFSRPFTFLNIGYRLQPRAKGFLFRAVYSPILGKRFTGALFAGISFGYKF